MNQLDLKLSDLVSNEATQESQVKEAEYRQEKLHAKNSKAEEHIKAIQQSILNQNLNFQ